MRHQKLREEVAEVARRMISSGLVTGTSGNVISDDCRVPLAPYTTYGTEELTRHASETLGESHRACLLQNHGTITVGDGPAKAFSLGGAGEHGRGLLPRQDRRRTHHSQFRPDG